MRLFVGLGNPGSQYARHRHNIGFMALDRIAADHGFGPWRSRFHGSLTEGRLGGERVMMLKPGTFMNRSGQAVQAALAFYKLAPAALIVFHDDLDLAPGKVRFKTGGGHAGHNGLRSIHAAIGEGYGRVRLGIGHPGHRDLVSGYVLHDFARGEAGWLDAVLAGLSDGAPALAAGDGARFLNAVALRTAPPRSGGGAGGGDGGGPSGRPEKGRRTGRADRPGRGPSPDGHRADRAGQDAARARTGGPAPEAPPAAGGPPGARPSGPGRAGPSAAGPGSAGPGSAGPGDAGLSWAEPGKAGSGKAGSDRVGSDRVGSDRAEAATPAAAAAPGKGKGGDGAVQPSALQRLVARFRKG